MTRGLSFNNRPQTQNAIDTCGWVAPPYVDSGAGRHVAHATIGTPILAVPVKVRAEKHGAKWCAIGTGVASLEGEEFDVNDDVERGRELPDHAQAQPGNGKSKAIEVEPVGAESGVVERHGKAKTRTA